MLTDTKNILTVLRSIQGFRGISSAIKKNDLFEAILEYSAHLEGVVLEDFVCDPKENQMNEISKLSQEVERLKREMKSLEFDRNFAKDNLKAAHENISLKKDLENLRRETEQLKATVLKCGFPKLY